jgi:alkaline phosphatase D
MSYIKQNKISGIVFLSGDRHLAELIVEKDSSFYPLYDFTASPFTAGINFLKDGNGNWRKEINNPMRVEGTLVSDKHNFGMFRFKGPRSQRTMTLEVHDVSGELRWSKTIYIQELQPQ